MSWTDISQSEVVMLEFPHLSCGRLEGLRMPWVKDNTFRPIYLDPAHCCGAISMNGDADYIS